MIKQNKATFRTLTNSLAAVILVGLTLLFLGYRDYAIGFCLGGLLSLMSLVSLKLFIPMLFHPGASAKSSGLLTVVMFCKLPLYGIVLYAATHFSSAPIAILAGCALVPVVITLETLAKMATEKARRQPRLRSALLAAELKTFTAVELAHEGADLKAETHEPRARAAQAQRVREGVS